MEGRNGNNNRNHQRNNAQHRVNGNNNRNYQNNDWNGNNNGNYQGNNAHQRMNGNNNRNYQNNEGNGYSNGNYQGNNAQQRGNGNYNNNNNRNGNRANQHGNGNQSNINQRQNNQRQNNQRRNNSDDNSTSSDPHSGCSNNCGDDRGDPVNNSWRGESTRVLNNIEQRHRQAANTRQPRPFNPADYPFNTAIRCNGFAERNFKKALDRRCYYDSLNWPKDLDGDLIMVDALTQQPVWFTGPWRNPCVFIPLNPGPMDVEDWALHETLAGVDDDDEL
ncbi:hypothetical protein SLS54_004828 [Diplodia seriata]